jgi:hypothetical protein
MGGARLERANSCLQGASSSCFHRAFMRPLLLLREHEALVDRDIAIR